MSGEHPSRLIRECFADIVPYTYSNYNLLHSYASKLQVGILSGIGASQIESTYVELLHDVGHSSDKLFDSFLVSVAGNHP